MQIYENSFKLLNCKTTASAYAILNDNDQLMKMAHRPNICGVPYCKKCERERQGRLMQTYKPYFDAYSSPWIRHIICTVPVISRSELCKSINIFLTNVKRFHESIRKTYRYPFRAVLGIEAHYQPDTDTYNLHVHYGVFSMVDIRRFRSTWCKVFSDESLLVKFPQNRGKTRYRVRKGAFLEYVTRRRAEQARRMPIEDYILYLQNQQLIKRIGFNKAYLALVTTLRKAEEEKNKLPDGYSQIFAGNFDITYDFTRIEPLFRRRYEQIWESERDILSSRSMVFRAFKDALVDLERELAKVSKVHEQLTLKGCPVI